MLEQWLRDGDILRRLSKHIDSGEKLPQTTIDRMLEVQNLNGAYRVLKQIFYASYDLIVHSASSDNPELRPDGYFGKIRSSLKRRKNGRINTEDLWARLRKEITGIE